jgi:hypothetical protein
VPTPPFPQEAELGDILDSFAYFASLEMGTSSSLGSAGIKQTFGQQIPEAYNGGGFPQMMFWVGPGGGAATPRTTNRGAAHTGQWTDITEIQGCLVLADRAVSLPVALPLMYPWVRRVWSAFWKHQAMVQGSPPVAYVGAVTPVKWKPMLALPWGTGKFAAAIFTWDVEQVIRNVQAGT